MTESPAEKTHPLIPPTPVPPAGGEPPTRRQQVRDFSIGFGAALGIFVLGFTIAILTNILAPSTDFEPLYVLGAMGGGMLLTMIIGFVLRRPLIALGVVGFLLLFAVLFGIALAISFA